MLHRRQGEVRLTFLEVIAQPAEGSLPLSAVYLSDEDAHRLADTIYESVPRPEHLPQRGRLVS